MSFRSYLDRTQESPTLDLVRDCHRFVAGYFEIISASSAHIYHSALVVAPQESIVRQLYESHARPFTRVVHGAPTSWDPNTAAASRPSGIRQAAWSPCSRFIAISWGDIPTIDVLDSVTLQRLQTFRPSPNVPALCGVLIFSPDGRILRYHGIPDGDYELCVSSWDLQTGGLVSTIRLQGPGPGQQTRRNPSIAHSASGGIVGVVHWDCGKTDALNIFICDVASGAYMHSHLFNNGTPLSYDIWIHGESFRFATADAATITIWEIGFTLDAMCTEVKTLRTPVGFVYKDFFPDTTGRPPSDLLCIRTFGDMILLAYNRSERILVWDVRDLKCLLDCEDAEFHGSVSFSSDGRFLACSNFESTVYLWKESPIGYVLHRILPPSGALRNPLPSPNGESIITFRDHMIQLWRTREITTPPSGALTRARLHIGYSVLDFSPDGKLAVVAAQKGNTVAVLNLESGVPQLTIDVGTKVYGLRVIGNIIVVVGGQEFSDYKVISWNLPAGDCVPDARVDCKDSARTVNLYSWIFAVFGATISSDFRYVALMISGYNPALCIYSASTGEHLQTVKTGPGADKLWFTPDGSDIWRVAYTGEAEAEVWRVGERGEPERLELAADIEHPPEGYPWRSSRGYRVTNDWWILGPDEKRLLMLPPLWQSYPVHRIWQGKFLALLHGRLSEPVILEIEP